MCIIGFLNKINDITVNRKIFVAKSGNENNYIQAKYFIGENTLLYGMLQSLYTHCILKLTNLHYLTASVDQMYFRKCKLLRLNLTTQ